MRKQIQQITQQSLQKIMTGSSQNQSKPASSQQIDRCIFPKFIQQHSQKGIMK